ncbi:18518_t:CDS:2, partial [Acaulospora morrowiae]
MKVGGYYLDKTVNTHVILSLHLRRFRKTLFLSTLTSYYDIKSGTIQMLFENSYIGKNPTKLACSFLVLKLNFAGLRTNSTFDVFNVNFHTIFNVSISDFMDHYQQELGHHFQVIDKSTDALRNFERLLNAVKWNDYKLYVFIDEYDA